MYYNWLTITIYNVRIVNACPSCECWTNLWEILQHNVFLSESFPSRTSLGSKERLIFIGHLSQQFDHQDSEILHSLCLLLVVHSTHGQIIIGSMRQWMLPLGLGKQQHWAVLAVAMVLARVGKRRRARGWGQGASVGREDEQISAAPCLRGADKIAGFSCRDSPLSHSDLPLHS